MCGRVCSITTTVLGVILVIVAFVVSFVVIPIVINNTILNEVILFNDTIQMDRFEELPFPLNFSVRVFSIQNPDEVMQGAKPIVLEMGPYIYSSPKQRLIDAIDEDTITFRGFDGFNFDVEGSYPFTEDDIINVPNIPYNTVLQVAEVDFPGLLGIVNSNLDNVFREYSAPIISVSVRDLFWEGFRFCVSPGILGTVICDLIKSFAADSDNIIEQEDGSIIFSLFGYRDSIPGIQTKMGRGVSDPAELGKIFTLNNSSRLDKWVDDGENTSMCNMINGTDGTLFAPFVDRNEPLYVYSDDICRSVTLRYQYDTEYEGIPVVRYTANEWMFDNDEGCFCLNVTTGINAANGCMLRGAMELYTCVGAFLVLSNAHFLYADPIYQNGVEGLNPDADLHRITVDLEPNTGIAITGASRAQFNMFLRPITSITTTENITTTLVPIFWVDEGMRLPQEYVEEVVDKLLRPLRLVSILVPCAIAITIAIVIVGVFFIYRSRRKNITV